MGVSEDTSGFATIVPMYAPAMLRLAAAYVGAADAEDAVQEAAMRAWQAWATLRSVESVRPWLLQITVNVCRHWRRGLKRQQQAHMQSLADDDPQAPALLEMDLGTSDHTGALDLRAAVNALSSELRSVVVLRFYVGLDATEIGGVLGIPPGTVRSRLHRALIQMREQLASPDLASGSRLNSAGTEERP